jgi:3-dehydroquinate synthase
MFLTSKICLYDCKNIAIITDTCVKKLYGDQLQNSLAERGLKAKLFSFPAGEQSKSREVKERIEDEMFDEGFSRDTLIIALGGGIVTDLAGFVAATFCRGIPYISIPTTLLGMVDASHGGKVGVNTRHGKNLIGAFHRPLDVIVDLTFLQTLPQEELLNGKAEIIKYGLIHTKEILGKALDVELIEECIRIKKEIVLLDPLDKGIRRILNFGHTFGHAVEKVYGYNISHGQAVALGMVLESNVSFECGLLSKDERDTITDLIQENGFTLSWDLPHEVIMSALTADKKTMDGSPRFVLLEKIGKAATFNGAKFQ